jgi:Tol biopolymer transport system component
LTPRAPGLSFDQVGYRLASLAIVLCLTATAAAAQITNGSFEETPNHLNGWTLGPGARVEALQSGDFGPTSVPVPDGTWLALLSTGPGDVPTAPSGDFDSNGTTDNDAATLSTTFTTVLDDETLTFDWAFITDEVGSGGQGQPQFDDLFDVTIDGNSILSGSVRKPGGSSPFPDTEAYDDQRYTVNSPGLTDGSDFGTGVGGGRTQFYSFSVTIAAPGTYTLQFLVADQADSLFDSGLLIDNVEVGTFASTAVQITASNESLTELKGGDLHLTVVNNFLPASSGDGSRLAFRSNGDYEGNNPNLEEQIWISTRSGTVFTHSRVTAAVNQEFGNPEISANGNWLAFPSTADLVPPGNTDGNLEIFRYDVGAGTFQQITTTTGCDNQQPTISDGGDRVAFVSDCNFGISAGDVEIVLWDGTFRGVDTSGCQNRSPRISRDAAGRYVSFITDCDGPYGSSNGDGGLEVVQWDTQTDLYLEVTVTTAGLFNDAVTSSADGRFLSFISDADHETGENPAGAWVVFRYDRNSGSFLQLVNQSPLAFFTFASIEPAGDFVAAERFDAISGGVDVVLLSAAVPGTEYPIAKGTATVYNSVPVVGVQAGGEQQVVFLSNDDPGGNNPDGNAELWVAGTTFDPPVPALYCSTPNVAIPDRNNGGVNDIISVPTGGTLTDLDVWVRIDHTFVGDLRIDLRHLDTGTQARLIDRPGRPPGAGCTGNDIDATLDDAAASDVEDECVIPGVAILGTFVPNQDLGRFNGEDLAGDWRLNVSDRRASNVGTLLEWCLMPTTP